MGKNGFALFFLGLYVLSLVSCLVTDRYWFATFWGISMAAEVVGILCSLWMIRQLKRSSDQLIEHLVVGAIIPPGTRTVGGGMARDVGLPTDDELMDALRKSTEKEE